MLETLVSSKVRRTLLEHLLAHPDERFYLRGLAKELALSISPLRRELLRLERLGMLNAYDEANIRFYVVNQASPAFLQLRQAASSMDGAVDASVLSAAEEPESVDAPAGEEAAVESPAPVAPAVAVRRRRSVWAVLAGGVSIIASAALVFAAIAHVAAPKPRARRVVLSPATVGQGPVSFSSPSAVPETRATLTAYPQSGRPMETPSASGEMRSSRWRLQPGTIGGGWSQ